MVGVTETMEESAWPVMVVAPPEERTVGLTAASWVALYTTGREVRGKGGGTGGRYSGVPGN